MNLSVCIDAVFHGQDAVQSLNTLAGYGVKAFEFWGWWDKDLNRIKAAKDELNLDIAAFCTRFISLVDPSQRQAYLAGLEESILAAQFMGCKTLITQVGADTGAERGIQEESLIAGLRACIPLLERAAITLVFEPLNTLVDHQGYYLYRSDEAFRVAGQVDSPQVKVLYDIYHQQIMEGHLIRRITENIGRIGHFHAAGNPGRNELYYGEINYPEVFRAIQTTGYQGYVGLEYFPKDDPVKGITAFL